MNKIKIISGLILLFVLTAMTAEAARKRMDYFLKPQAGIWFGPITPVYTTYDQVDTNLGGGIFFRYNLPWQYFKIGVDASYQYFPSEGVNTLSLWPVYGSLIYRIPYYGRIPLTFQLKTGAGGTYIRIRPDRVSQWDPVGMLGIEGSFPAGRLVNIGLRIDYLLIYEQYIPGAKRNGHVIDTGITLYFNI